eukprot:7307752-Lingulodinium_polyedra.AAC.1
MSIWINPRRRFMLGQPRPCWGFSPTGARALRVRRPRPLTTDTGHGASISWPPRRKGRGFGEWPRVGLA